MHEKNIDKQTNLTWGIKYLILWRGQLTLQINKIVFELIKNILTNGILSFILTFIIELQNCQ